MFADYFHQPPKGFHYELEKFDAKYIRINLHHHCKYDYNLGESVKTIWGFYNKKTGKFHSPINFKKVGKMVDLSETTPYTAIIPLKKIV